jgi:hypothetical protein
VGGGNILKGEFLGYHDRKVKFSHPPLQLNKMYVLQIVKKSALWLSNGGNDEGGIVLAANQDFEQNLTKGQKLLNDLKTDSKEYEVYKYLFKTSRYSSLASKVNDLKNGVSVQGGNPPLTTRTIRFTAAKEGFDICDNQQNNFDWYLDNKSGGQGSGGNGNTQINQASTNFYWEDYLEPFIYQAYNNVLIPVSYPALQKINPTTYMQVKDPLPLLDKVMVQQILDNPMGQGIQLAIPPSSQEVEFILFGEAMAYHLYQHHLMPRLFNLSNPQIFKAVTYQAGYNVLLRQLMDYHIVHPNFKTLSSGNYHVLSHSKMNQVQDFLIDWKKSFGIKMN